MAERQTLSDFGTALRDAGTSLTMAGTGLCGAHLADADDATELAAAVRYIQRAITGLAQLAGEIEMRAAACRRDGL